MSRLGLTALKHCHLRRGLLVATVLMSQRWVQRLVEVWGLTALKHSHLPTNLTQWRVFVRARKDWWVVFGYAHPAGHLGVAARVGG